MLFFCLQRLQDKKPADLRCHEHLVGRSVVVSVGQISFGVAVGEHADIVASGNAGICADIVSSRGGEVEAAMLLVVTATVC